MDNLMENLCQQENILQMTSEDSQTTQRQSVTTNEIEKKLNKSVLNSIAGKEIKIHPELLRTLYLDDSFTVKNIANIFSLNEKTIRNKLKKFDIKKIKYKKPIPIKKVKTRLSFNFLKECYCDKQMTQDEISEISGYSRIWIGKKLREFDLKKELITLNEVQDSIIMGSMLGDGNLKKINRKNSCFRKSQKTSNLEYLQWHFEVLKPFSSKIYPINNTSTVVLLNGKPKRIPSLRHLDGYDFYTNSHNIFSQLEKKWYARGPNGDLLFKAAGNTKYRIKVIPKDIILTPLSIAIWFCDDGCNNFHSNQIILCTESFSFEDVKFLVKQLNTFGFNPVIKETKHGHRIIFNTKDYLKFIKFVSPYIIWDCFKYKTDLSKYINEKESSKCSNIKGVVWNDFSNKWIVYENKKSRKILGYFDNLEEAIKEKQKYV